MTAKLDYSLKLLNAINEYSSTAEQTEKIRKLICYISESPNIEKTEDIKELITEGARLIRVFGYYDLNGIDPKVLCDADDRTAIKNELIFGAYKAKSGRGDRVTYLDKQQKDIIDTFNGLEKKRIFVSAPTSFGKTHILKEILFSNSERYNNIVLIFPTVALLTENVDSITEFVNRHNLDYAISNNFQPQDETPEKIDETHSRNIYILTPERAIRIFEDQPRIKVDFFFFDEIYKVDEDFNSSDEYELDVEPDSSDTIPKYKNLKYSRAVAFRLVLYFLSKYTQDFYLAGPYIDLDNIKPGMERFLQKFEIKKIQIETEATLKSFYNAWSKNVETHNDIEGHSSIELDGKYDTDKDKVKTIIKYINANDWGQTLVYSDTPKRAIERAMHLDNNRKESKDALVALINHLQSKYLVKVNSTGKDSVDEWSLIKVLRNSTGVHHGKLPRYIQREMLRLFNEEVINTLFCTSTIIEGVNTKAKNIIVSSNYIRKSQQLNQFDVKNIIGRAGRYYHHFMGRVFFINERQNDIMEGVPQQLNFPLFDNVSLSMEDIDNMDIDNVDPHLEDIKSKRDQSLNRELLPDVVFYKNRLFDRKQQERMIENIKLRFDEFQIIFGKKDTYSILQEDELKLCLDTLYESEIITDKQKNSFLYIALKYYRKGIIGLIDFELNNKNAPKKVDEGYDLAFKKRSTIIEYQFPRYFFLIEALYNHLCEMGGIDDKKVDLSKLCRFFETGAKTLIGQHLIDCGMPGSVVKRIEDKYGRVRSMSLKEGQSFLYNGMEAIIRAVDMDSLESREFVRIVRLLR